MRGLLENMDIRSPAPDTALAKLPDLAGDSGLHHLPWEAGPRTGQVSFEGIRDAKGYEKWQDGVSLWELLPENFKTVTDELCDGVGFARMDVARGPSTSCYYMQGRMEVNIFQEWLDVQHLQENSPLFSCGHEFGHYAAYQFGELDKMSNLQNEIWADSAAVFLGALEGIDLRGETAGLRGRGRSPAYPCGELAEAAADFAYDRAAQYDNTKLTPGQRREALRDLLYDLKAQTPGISNDNYRSSEFFQNRNSTPREQDRLNEGLNARAERLPDVFSAFARGDALKPNAEYRTGEYDYCYKTDEHARIISFQTDHLQLTQREERLPLAAKVPDIIEGADDRGHLFADLFGGSPELVNLVPQDMHLNRGAYKAMENDWADALRGGSHVEVAGAAVYEDDSRRPSSFEVFYVIDGEVYEKSFANRRE
ncbi:MAG: DNA/RNA non-specific endonuclease [Firmicutes bacterium]|nr:DNA/RNA non-specific endonuclease [Bacillota bacterium]